MSLVIMFGKVASDLGKFGKFGIFLIKWRGTTSVRVTTIYSVEPSLQNLVCHTFIYGYLMISSSENELSSSQFTTYHRYSHNIKMKKSIIGGYLLCDQWMYNCLRQHWRLWVIFKSRYNRRVIIMLAGVSLFQSGSVL